VDEHHAEGGGQLSLRERIPEYLAVFGTLLAGAIGVGLAVGMISDVAVTSSIGYTVMLLGVVLLLAGGASGGGYTNMGVGAVTAMFQPRRTDEDHDELSEAWGRTGRTDPKERLRRGLRPEANPRAFWQVIGGISYVAIGLAFVVLTS